MFVAVDVRTDLTETSPHPTPIFPAKKWLFCGFYNKNRAQTIHPVDFITMQKT